VTVQSVLDVKDDNPMPKGANPASQFNRSILVLTPERALKFTATTRERHYVWLTALSFLSHSPLSFGDLAALPPIPQEPAKPPDLGRLSTEEDYTRFNPHDQGLSTYWSAVFHCGCRHARNNEP
jgi:hypothetical protein